jgi:hypothetical protein
MNFVCPVNEVRMTSPCGVKSCMWFSVKDSSGCMAKTGLPEAEDLNDATVARHKGISIGDVSRIRLEATQRLQKVATVHAFLEWSNQVESPYLANNSVSEALRNAVNSWCTQHWVFQIPELHWDVLKVARCMHRPTVNKFCAHVGKKIDWLALLEIDSASAKKLVALFRAHQLSKESS